MTVFTISAMVMLCYFEILGQSINALLKTKNLPFNFVIGFLSHLAFGYVTSSILAALNQSFCYVLIDNLILFILGIILIFLKRKELRIFFKWYELVVFLALSIFALYFSYITTLGDLDGFDSLHYINLTVGQINSKPGLFNFNNLFGFVDFNLGASNPYKFQTYYSFCATIIYVLKDLLNLNIFYSSAYVWIFQIVFSCSLVSILVNAIRNEMNKKRSLMVLMATLFATYYLKFYFYNVFGFYGNSFRIVAISYACLFFVRLFNEKNKSDRYLISLMLLAGCSFTSTFLFFVYLFLFGILIVRSNEDQNIFKWYALTLLLPTVNLLKILYMTLTISIVISILLSATLWIFNDYIYKIINLKYTKKCIVIVAFLAMFLLSYKVTGSFRNIDAFTNNLSQFQDMTIDYFEFAWYKWFKIVVLISLFGSMIVCPKNKMVMISWILIIVIFNPWCCSFFNKINQVYYRSYDVILNPYLVIYYYSIINDKVKNNIVNYSYQLYLTIMLFTSTSILVPLYYHSSFKPSDDYDYVNKMSKTEVDVIREIAIRSEENNITNPFICSPNRLTFGAIGKGRHIYGREYEVPWMGENVMQIHKIFRPVNYYGEDYYIPDYYGDAYNFEPDYKHIYDRLKNAGIDILVVSKDMDYYDEEKDVYYPLRNVVEWWYDYPDYENEDYCLYMINRK